MIVNTIINTSKLRDNFNMNSGRTPHHQLRIMKLPIKEICDSLEPMVTESSPPKRK